MKKIVESVPNYSEGKDKEKIEKIVTPFKGIRGVKLLDYVSDMDHNRLVVTVIGEPEPLKEAIIESVGVAVELIDMRLHKGEHPRMGAVDVIPFIPVKNVTMEDAILLSRQTAQEVWEKYRLPVFLYEASAICAERADLSAIRRGQFEGMAEKIKRPEWKPDFGEPYIHPTAGVVAIGARMPLIAFNVNLGTENIEIANAIAKAVRHSSGGLRYCKAMGVNLKERNVVQVSMNLTDFTKTPLYRVFEMIRSEARRYGVPIVGSEIVGLLPAQAIVDVASYYMGLEGFHTEQVLEMRLID